MIRAEENTTARTSRQPPETKLRFSALIGEVRSLSEFATPDSHDDKTYFEESKDEEDTSQGQAPCGEETREARCCWNQEQKTAVEIEGPGRQAAEVAAFTERRTA
jgi:hypothetical protein